MPSEVLQAAIRECFARAKVTVRQINTLEMTHPAIAEPLRIVQGFQELECTLENDEVVTFQPVPFSFKLPASGENGLQELQLQIDNVDNQAGDFCRAALSSPDPVICYFRPYLSTDLTDPQMVPPLRLFLLNVKINSTTVTARAASQNFLNQPYPSEDYTVEDFPGLISV